MSPSERDKVTGLTDATLLAAFDAAMTSILEGVPPDEREEVRRRCLDNLQSILVEAPFHGDAVETVRMRARLAAVFFGPRSTRA